ncbi:MAG: aminotransferase class V-fold PLP-dependent enzyme [Bryobacterales bacterium]|nr:aminotransferase class V-fold PLP-dependent enzyme [Bryobacterales bacterium]
MPVNRRHFLTGSVATASSAASRAGTLDFESVRADFPRTRNAAYMDNASSHPISVYSSAALHRYVDWVTNEIGEPWWPYWTAARQEAKDLFARLINADPSEVSFARSTIEAESNLLNGINIQASGGNVVTNDLHYSAAIYNYKMRQRDGLDVRIVKHRDWQIDLRDLERAVDRKTKLVSLALVSNVNGYLADIKAISDLAHAHGAYVYADIIQCVGAIPIDVKAMGIDLAACSTYKWLMGMKGFGFMYVRKDLQGTFVRPTQHSGGVRFNYAPWVANPEPGMDDIAFQPVTGPSRYEVSYASCPGIICAQESLKYIHRLGVRNIRNHVRTLTDRLHKELPSMGYPSITPKGNESPIVAFTFKDPDTAMRKLRKADVHVAMRFGNKMRIAPSVFNNMSDIDRLLGALA